MTFVFWIGFCATLSTLLFVAVPLLVGAHLRIRFLEGELEATEQALTESDEEACEIDAELGKSEAELKLVADSLATLYHSIKGEMP